MHTRSQACSLTVREAAALCQFLGLNHANMRFEGVLKSWNDERGFGFIVPTQGGQEIFVHIKAFPRGITRPRLDRPIAFEIELGPQGKKRAKNVRLVQEHKSTKAEFRQTFWATVVLNAVALILLCSPLGQPYWRPQ
jgi:cold shock CspA family protein